MPDVDPPQRPQAASRTVGDEQRNGEKHRKHRVTVFCWILPEYKRVLRVPSKQSASWDMQFPRL